jgi:hypothetical protein
MAYRTVHVQMWISGVETRKEGLPGEMGEGLERGEKGEGGNISKEVCEKVCKKMSEKICEKIGKTVRK